MRASEHLQLLTINKQNILAMDCNAVESGVFTKGDYLSHYKDVFSGEGKLEGQLHVEINQTVQAVQLPTRRVPIALKGRLRKELDRLSHIGVIQRVDSPTDWISAIVVITKRNGTIRLCIDPKPLNQTLHRNHYPSPTIDGVLPLLAKAHLFTVLDAKNGFWHIQLDEPSSLAITFATTLGRYHFILLHNYAVLVVSSSGRISEAN